MMRLATQDYCNGKNLPLSKGAQPTLLAELPHETGSPFSCRHDRNALAPLIQANFRENPLDQASEVPQHPLLVHSNQSLIGIKIALDVEITSLYRTTENEHHHLTHEIPAKKTAAQLQHAFSITTRLPERGKYKFCR